MIPPGRSGLRLLKPFLALVAPCVLSATSAVAFGVVGSACYNAGDGTTPPGQQIYFPIGLVVSKGGSVLYVANSDFDLQWNGGTVQSYDLVQVRRDAVIAIKDPTLLANPRENAVRSWPNGILTRPLPAPNPCPSDPPIFQSDGSGTRQPLGEACSPPVDATYYVRDSVVIGAFATDMRLSCAEANLQPSRWPLDPDDAAKQRRLLPCTQTRLYVPVRGDASLTWGDVVADEGNLTHPAPKDTPDSYPPFKIDCGTRINGRCDSAHHAGSDPFEANNTRHVTMPGEPFGMAESEDGSSVVVTHQTDTKVSLLSTGFDPTTRSGPTEAPALQFVLDGLPVGGNGIATVPHDPDAFPVSGPDLPPNPAFIFTTRAAPEIDLLRFYYDQGAGPGVPQDSALHRPFLSKEATFSLTANAGSTDSRGLVIDPTPRIRCKMALPANATAAQKKQCARRPARVFIANRSPATLLVGEIGQPAADGSDTYDADRIVIYQNIPLTFGPSRVYLGPIVDATGHLALRVFIVCFDSSAIFIFDPEAGVVENIIRTGQGPYAVAFDPFDLDQVAAGAAVNDDPRLASMDPDLTVKTYRFMYVASFTKSFIQLVDLDNSRIKKDTFERVVYSLGQPTLPKGTH